MIVATRNLTVRTKAGETKPATVSLFAPVQDQELWRCEYRIDWPDDGWPAQSTSGHARGADGMHALQMALQKLGLELHQTSYHQEGKMFWVPGRTGYGFIVPKDARDLLKGDDALFYG